MIKEKCNNYVGISDNSKSKKHISKVSIPNSIQKRLPL